METNDTFGSGGMWIFALLILLLLGGGNGLFGGAAATTNAVSQADLQRAIDLNSIQTGQAGISSDIQRGIYEINGATKDAAYNNLGEIRDVGASVATNSANIINNLTAITAQMQNCCCETRSAIMENRYLDAQNTAAINANTTAAVQKVLDAVQQSKIDSLTAQVNALQTAQAVAGVPRINPYYYGIYPACSGNTNI